jgi:fucose permease
MGEGTLSVWAVIYLTENKDLSLEAAAGALSSFWIAMTAGRLLSTAVVRKARPLPMSLTLAAGMAVSFLLVAHAHGPADSLLRFGLAGLCCSAIFPLLLGLASEELPGNTPQVSALFAAAVATGLSIGTFGIGPLRAHLGLETIYTISAAGPVLLIALLVIMARTAKLPAGAGRPR